MGINNKTIYPKVITQIVFFILFYVFLPAYLAVRLNFLPLKLLLTSYLASIFIILYLLKMHSNRRYRLSHETEDLQEKVNILHDQNSKELKNKLGLQEKIRRYSKLEDIIEKINQNLDLEAIADTLTAITFSLIADNRGNCIFSLIDNQTYKPNLFKAKKEDRDLVIKTKEGDIFDLWVLRHSSPLLIEDIRKDFRFDLEKLKTQYARPVLSLISSPLISDHKFLGILRLDHPDAGFYSQDDLRLLVTICDLGAVALENGELFHRTQDLAIHDGLTSLYTKGYFLERLKEECRRSIRKIGSFSLLMLDIDHFKKYNDKFGHTAGDVVLKNLSRNITESLEGLNSIISRFGGEEFCVILPAVDKKKAYAIAEALRAKIEKAKIILRMQETAVTVSIGVTSCPADSSNEEELIFKADRAMYEAKQKGRNRVIGA